MLLFLLTSLLTSAFCLTTPHALCSRSMTESQYSPDYHQQPFLWELIKARVHGSALKNFPFRKPTMSASSSQLWVDYVEAKHTGRRAVLADFSHAGYKYSEAPIPHIQGPVFGVLDYGAQSGQYCDEAIQKTIAAAEAAGGGVVYFPPGVYHVSPDSNPDHLLFVRTSNIVLRGAGTDPPAESVIVIETMKPVNSVHQITVTPTIPRGQSLAKVTKAVARGDYSVEVDSGKKVSIGQEVYFHHQSISLAKSHYDPMPLSNRYTRLHEKGFLVTEHHRVVAVEGNRVVFGEPIQIDIPLCADSPILLKESGLISEVGIEDLKFVGRWDAHPEEFVHHKDAIHDYGWEALRVDRVRNGWMRRCVFEHLNTGLTLDSCCGFTVENCRFVGKRGHSALVVRRGYGVLVKDCIDTAGHHHGPNVGYQGVNTVYLDLVVWNYHHRSRDSCCCNVHYDFWTGHKVTSRPEAEFCLPILVGLHGDTVSVDTSSCMAVESLGAPVWPPSLFEAQLALRLGHMCPAENASCQLDAIAGRLTGLTLSAPAAPCGVNLLKDPSFEEMKDAGRKKTGWEDYKNGFYTSNVGRGVTGPGAIKVEGTDQPRPSSGAMQKVSLAQTAPKTIAFSGWAKVDKLPSGFKPPCSPNFYLRVTLTLTDEQDTKSQQSTRILPQTAQKRSVVPASTTPLPAPPASNPLKVAPVNTSNPTPLSSNQPLGSPAATTKSDAGAAAAAHSSAQTPSKHNNTQPANYNQSHPNTKKPVLPFGTSNRANRAKAGDSTTKRGVGPVVYPNEPIIPASGAWPAYVSKHGQHVSGCTCKCTSVSVYPVEYGFWPVFLDYVCLLVCIAIAIFAGVTGNEYSTKTLIFHTLLILATFFRRDHGGPAQLSGAFPARAANGADGSGTTTQEAKCKMPSRSSSSSSNSSLMSKHASNLENEICMNNSFEDYTPLLGDNQGPRGLRMMFGNAKNG